MSQRDVDDRCLPGLGPKAWETINTFRLAAQQMQKLMGIEVLWRSGDRMLMLLYHQRPEL